MGCIVISEYDKEILAGVARCDLTAFAKVMSEDYLIGWVHREICETLMRFYIDVIEKRSPRLIITMPPRHGKSQIVSRFFPAWLFGVNPDIQIIAASYSADLAQRMNKDVQKIMDQPEYARVFPWTSLSSQRNAGGRTGAIRTMNLFEIPRRRGSYRSVGVGNGITGMGCHILNIDDPIKDRNDADSPTIRRKVWEWYTSTARSRLAPGGGVILTQTRWHEDDLAGRLLQKSATGEGEHFDIINYPAIAEHDEPHRKKGEALHPERYPISELQKLMKAVGSRDWEALYQQHPMPVTGGIFKREWFRFYIPGDEPKQFDQVIQSWDLSFKKTDTSDDVAGGVLGRLGADIYLLDCDSRQRGFVETKMAFEVMWNKWPQALAKIVEDKANGPALIDSLARTVPGIIAWKPRGSKTERANSVAPVVEAGNFWVPDPRFCPWSQRYIDQMCNFPGVTHDDMVDMTTQGIDYLITNMSNDSSWS